MLSTKHLGYLVDPSYQRVNRLFVLSFEDNAHETSYKQCILPIIEIKDYNIMIDEKKILISQLEII